MRLRITFSKNGPLKYSSHLDLMRVWERSLRRAGAPLAYSGGFNPRPKLQLASALPLGHTGEAELLDVWLERAVAVKDFTTALIPVLPDGLEIRQVQQVNPDEPAMQTQVVSAEYEVQIIRSSDKDRSREELKAEIETRIEQVLAKRELLQERRGRRYDLRPLIERLWLEPTTSEIVLGMQLAAREGATARPEAVLEALGMSVAFARYHRRRLLLAATSRVNTAG